MAGLVRDRKLTLSAFLIPVLAGIIFMACAGAPIAYPLTNAGAACIVAIAFWRMPQNGLRPSLLAVSIVVLLLLAATFAGPSLQDIHRWISVGPVKLHAAMLVLPFFAMQMFRRDRRVVSAVVAAAALIVMLQPDRASALALFLISLSWLYDGRDRWSLATLAISGIALSVTILKADTLPPVRFTETVIGDAAAIHFSVAGALLLTMVIAIAQPICVRQRGRLEGIAAWSACLAGYFLASLAGPYPVPLLGYGVSPIFGFGLALAMVGRESDEAA